MTNHAIKAKNKKTGKMVEVTHIRSFDKYDEYRIKSVIGIYSKKEFNDLFEVVEDIPQTDTYTISKEDKNSFYKKTLHSSLLCNDTGCIICAVQQGKKITTAGIPQTDTLKKGDWKIDEDGNKYLDVTDMFQDLGQVLSSKEDWEETTQRFHDLYEKYSWEFGYETRVETGKLDFNSPNGKLMLKVVSEVITKEIVKAREEERVRIVGEINKQFPTGLLAGYDNDLDITDEIISIIKRK